MSSRRSNYLLLLSPSKIISKTQEWINGYVKLFLGVICSVSCLFCMFTFIWYLTIRGLYGFLVNLQIIGDQEGLDMGHGDIRSSRRKSFFTRCKELKAQADHIQMTLRKKRTTEQSSTGIGLKANGKSSPDQKLRQSCNHTCQNDAGHTLLVHNSSYVSEVYYDGDGHKIGEQIYLTNDSDGLEESFFEVKVNNVQHLRDIGGDIASSKILVEEPVEEEATRPPAAADEQEAQEDPLIEASEDGLENDNDNASDKSTHASSLTNGITITEVEEEDEVEEEAEGHEHDHCTILTDPTDGLEQCATEPETIESTLGNGSSDIASLTNGQNYHHYNDEQTTMIEPQEPSAERKHRRRRKNKK